MFREFRSMGLLIGAELSEQFAGRAPELVSAALREGVMLLNAGPNVLRFAPSLVIPFADIDEGFARIGKAFAASTAAA